jgi:hypothetical protein
MTVVDPGATGVWPAPAGAAPDGGGARKRALGRVVPAALVALVLGWLVDWWLAVLVLVATAVLTTVAAVSPVAARGIERVLGAVGHGVGRVLSAVILTVVFAVVFVPVGLLSRLVRRDPLTTGVVHPGTDWLERWGWKDRRLPDRTYASERDLLGGRRAGRVVWAVGLVAVVLLVDVALGTVLVDPPVDGAPPLVAAGTGEASAIPALSGLDYVPQLFAEQFAAESGAFDPYLGWRLSDVEGRYLNIADGERVSRTTTVPGDPVVVWFFGGSGMYGFGQRDDHTIASELVALAEDEGIALEAHNFGTPAYVNWQSVSLFSRLVTDREAPDLAVFYDGYNDLSMQLVDGPVGEPSHVLAAVQEDRVQAPDLVDRPPSASDVRSWWADHSATVNLWRRIRDRVDGDEAETQMTEAEASAVPADLDRSAVEEATDDLLARGRDLASAVAVAYGIDVAFWFQPTLFTKGAVEGEQQLIGRAANRSPAWVPVTEALRQDLPPEVVDLADALDGQADPLFWDVVHTNEDGARLVAEAAWPTLRRQIAGLSS